MQVRLFGGIAVVHADPADPGVLGASRVRTLLAVLASQAPGPASEAYLMTALWGDDPPRTARTALQTHVSALRDLLEPGRARRDPGRHIVHSPAGYALRVDADELDLLRFESSIARARTAARQDDTEAAIGLLDEALALSDQPLFGDLATEPWAIPVVSRVQDQRGAAFESRFGLEMDREPAVTDLDQLREAAEEFPYRERLIGQLALACYRNGDQDRALTVLAEARAKLREDKGLDVGRELRLLENAILTQDPSLQFRGRRRGPGTARPASTRRVLVPMVGRDRDLEAVAARLATHRLVTITGPSGAGKSTLAAHVADRLAADHPGGVHTVDLTDAADQDVLRSFAARLRVVDHPLVPLAENVVDALGDQPVLLVVDTCEVALEAVARNLAALLAAPCLRVLATSQAPLRLRAEHVHRLEPLDTASAITILTGASGPHSEVDPERADHRLSGIAERLDRLPLALELAAPRLAVLGTDELARLIDAGIELTWESRDRPGRHRSLDAAVSWSLDLLDESHWALLTRLLTHAAPFSARTVTTLWATAPLDAATIGDVLVDLVDRSLVSRVPGHEPRFRLLDGVRRSVAERVDPDELAAARSRLVDATFAALQASASGETAPLGLDDLGDEVLTVAEGLIGSGDDRTLYLASLLGSFAIERGQIGEARRLMAAALDAETDAPGLVRAMVLAQMGFLSWYQGDLRGVEAILAELGVLVDAPGFELIRPAVTGCAAFVEQRYATAQAELESALALLAPDPSSPTKPFLLLSHLTGNAALYAGDLEAAAGHYRAQRAAAEHLGDDFALAQALRFEAVVSVHRGDLDAALRWSEQSLRRARAGTDPVGVAQSHAVAAMVTWAAELHDEALDHAVQALEASVGHVDVFALRTALPVAAAGALDRGAPERAARLLGFYVDLLERTGHGHWPTVADLVAASTDAIRRALSTRAAMFQARGAAATTTQIVEDAAALVR